jgi:hypothetical protein
VSGESNGGKIENKNSFDEHHTSGVHNRFNGFEINLSKRAGEDRPARVWKKFEGDTAAL